MTKDWILQTDETKPSRAFANSTWVPLRESCSNDRGDIKSIGYISEYFGCGSVAFPPEHREKAETSGWSNAGVIPDTTPYAFDVGSYKPIDEYQYNDKETIGIHLVFELPQPVIGGSQWILNPDIIAALRLVKEKNSWVRPEENFVEVVREIFDENGNPIRIEIKKEFLIDYLAARNLSLRLSYYRQRVENVASIENSEYVDLEDHNEKRDGGRYELLIRNLNDVYGRNAMVFHMWRNDIDEEEDAPVIGPENDTNVSSKSYERPGDNYEGVRVESGFWRDEWIDHKGISIRVRRDEEKNLPDFIVETDGSSCNSSELNSEDVGRWLWFRSDVINAVLDLSYFSFEWCTSETARIKSTSGYYIHFGINSSDLINVYAYDIARLPAWEQKIWHAYNVLPEGKVSKELLSAQMQGQVANSDAVEDLLFVFMDMLEKGFHQKYNVALFSQNIDRSEYLNVISRFASTDSKTLLGLAKELIKVFSERLNKKELRKLSNHPEKEKLGSHKLLEDILAQKIDADKAHEILGPVVGVYDMRIGDAHITSSKIEEALKLARIDSNQSFLRQGEQLISNFAQSIFWIGKLLFEEHKS